MAYKNQWKNEPRNEPYLQPVNGIVQPPVIPPPNRPGRRTNVLDSLKPLLNVILRKRCAFHFKNPVDSKALGVPDYHTFIKRPMDLNTIKKRLKNNYYCQASEAIEDFTLIFENCMRFNREGTVVHQAGEELKTFFHKRLGMLDLTNELEMETKPKPKPGKHKKASEENPPQGRKGLAPPTHQSRSKRLCPVGTSKPKLPSLNPAASVPNEVEVEVKVKAKPKRNEVEVETKPKPKPCKRKKASEEKHPPGSTNRDQSRSKRFCPVGTSKPKLPSLDPPVSVPNEVEVEVKAKPGKRKKVSKERPPPGSTGLDSDQHQSRSKEFCPDVTSKPKLPSLPAFPVASVSNEMEVEAMPGKPKKAPEKKLASDITGLDSDQHQSRPKEFCPDATSKPKLPSLDPAASVSNEMEVEAMSGKPKKAPEKKLPSDITGLNSDPHQSWSKEFCPDVTSKTKLPSLDPVASVPNEMEVEAKPGKRKKASGEKPPRGRKARSSDKHRSRSKGLCPVGTSKHKLPSLDPPVSVPNEVEVKVKAKPGKRKKASKERPPPGSTGLDSDMHQSRSKRFCPGVTFKPKLPSLDPAASVSNEMEVEAMPSKPKKAPEKKPPSGSTGLDSDTHQSRSKEFCPDETSKPKLPSLDPAASVSNEMEVEAMPGKRKKASGEKPPRGRKARSSDKHRSRSKRLCPDETSKPKLPSLDPVASVPNEVEVEVKAKPGKRKKVSKERPPPGSTGLDSDQHQSRPKEFCPDATSKPKLPSLPAFPVASVSNEMEVEAMPGKPKKAPEKKLPSDITGLDSDQHQSRPKEFCPGATSKPKLPSLYPVASVSNEMEVEAMPCKPKKAPEKKPPSGSMGLDSDPHQSRSKEFCPDVTSKPKLPSLDPAASVSNEMEVEAMPSKPKKAPEKKPPSASTGLDSDPLQSRSKDFCPDVTSKPKLPSLKSDTSEPNKMKVKANPKRGKRKKASEETPPAGHRDLAADLQESRPKRFCPGIAHKPKLPRSKKAKPPPPPPLTFKYVNRMIERSHCNKLLQTMRRRKRQRITCIFNCARYLFHYTQNKDFNYKAEKRLDWATLYDRVNSKNFESFDSFVAQAQHMFQTGLSCFPEESLIRSNIIETISVFDAKLVGFKKRLKKEQDSARAEWDLKLQTDQAGKSAMPGVVVKQQPDPTNKQGTPSDVGDVSSSRLTQ